MSFASNLEKDTLYYSIGKIIPALISFVSISIFTRLLDPIAFGRYQLVITTISILSVIFSSWLQQSVYRYLREFKRKNEFTEFIKTYLGILLVIAIIACVVVIIICQFVPLEYRKLTILSPLLLMSYLMYMNLQVILQADLKAYVYSKYEIARVFLFLVTSLVLIQINHDYLSLVLSVLITYLLLSIGLTHRLGILNVVNHLSFNPKTAKKLFLFGYPMFFWFLGSQVLGFSDRFLLEYFRGSTEVGIYTSNYNLMSSALGLLTAPILLSMQTNIMNYWSLGETERARSAITSTSYYYIMFSLPILLITLLYSKEITRFALGEKFREGHIILPIVLLGFLANSLAMFIQKNYELEKRTKLIAGYLLAAAILNVGLNLYFIRAYGYVGAAITTAVAYIFYLLLVSLGYGVSWKFKYPWANLSKLGLSFTCIFLILIWVKSISNLNRYVIFGGSLIGSYILLIGILVLFNESYVLRLAHRIKHFIPLGIRYIRQRD